MLIGLGTAAAPWPVMGGAVIVACVLDRWLGEPPVRWHPVVWMGTALKALGERIAPLPSQGTPSHALPMHSTPSVAAPDWSAFLGGAAAWCVLAAVCAVAGCAVQAVAEQATTWVRHVLPAPSGAVLGGLVAAVLLGVALKPLMAWRMLLDEVEAVETALQQGLAAGRERLAWLVSRDVSTLTHEQVRESAIESLAENLNDSVVAPLFWFAVGGLPAAAVFRLANTADAMWGYRGERAGRVWEWAGKWAARADDVLGWLPARLTAVLLWPAMLNPACGWANARQLRAHAGLTPSPNSGWPMAAMALRLGVRLGKPDVYTLNAASPAPGAADVQQALKYAKNMASPLILIGVIAIVLGISNGA